MEEKKLNMDWLAALLLCFFLGCFGAHRFFVGKTSTAVAMLLITLLTGWIAGLGLFITGIWSLVDFIMIICGKFTNAKGEIIPWQV